MKRFSILLCSLLVSVSLAACSAKEVPSQVAASSVVKLPAVSQEAETAGKELISEPVKESDTELLVQLTNEKGEVILFALNDSNAAKSLYEQLPLSLEIEDYSNTEKIFYPPEKLDTTDAPMAEGPEGTLAYYAPWGNVAIYYGDCGGASGLYQLG